MRCCSGAEKATPQQSYRKSRSLTINRTVQVTYAAGTSGGSITNCATATGVGVTDPVGQYTFVVTPPVSLSACNTQPIQQHTCVPGVPGCGWHDGDMVTWTQADWGDVPDGTNIATVFETNYAAVYKPSGVFQVGDPSGFTMFFGSAATVLAYLPSTGPVGALVADLIDPASSSSGEFGGDVAAARLALDFDDAGLIHGTAGLHFGDLSVCGLTATPAFNGLTVRQTIAGLQSALGGLPTSYTYADLDTLARSKRRSSQARRARSRRITSSTASARSCLCRWVRWVGDGDGNLLLWGAPRSACRPPREPVGTAPARVSARPGRCLKDEAE